MEPSASIGIAVCAGKYYFFLGTRAASWCTSGSNRHGAGTFTASGSLPVRLCHRCTITRVLGCTIACVVVLVLPVQSLPVSLTRRRRTVILRPGATDIRHSYASALWHRQRHVMQLPVPVLLRLEIKTTPSRTSTRYQTRSSEVASIGGNSQFYY